MAVMALVLLDWQSPRMRGARGRVPDFRPSAQYDPDPPKDPTRARVSRADLRRVDPGRRPVRRYDLTEDGSDGAR